MSQQISLRTLDANASYQTQHFQILDPFGSDVHVRLSCDGLDTSQDGVCCLIGERLGNHSSIDLDEIDL